MSVKAALDDFGEKLKHASRRGLIREGKRASGKLYKSIDYKTKESPNSFQFSFSMEDYGRYVDQGVRGVGGTKADGTSWKRKKVFGDDFGKIFSFKKGGKKNRPSPRHFDKWTIRRGLAPRTSGGQFAKRSSLKFAIANSVYHTGIETTNFFTKPFFQLFKTLPDDVVEAYGLEVDKFLKSSFNND